MSRSVIPRAACTELPGRELPGRATSSPDETPWKSKGRSSVCSARCSASNSAPSAVATMAETPPPCASGCGKCLQEVAGECGHAHEQQRGGVRYLCRTGTSGITGSLDGDIANFSWTSSSSPIEEIRSSDCTATCGESFHPERTKHDGTNCHPPTHLPMRTLLRWARPPYSREGEWEAGIGDEASFASLIRVPAKNRTHGKQASTAPPASEAAIFFAHSGCGFFRDAGGRFSMREKGHIGVMEGGLPVCPCPFLVRSEDIVHAHGEGTDRALSIVCLAMMMRRRGIAPARFPITPPSGLGPRSNVHGIPAETRRDSELRLY